MSDDLEVVCRHRRRMFEEMELEPTSGMRLRP